VKATAQTDVFSNAAQLGFRVLIDAL